MNDLNGLDWSSKPAAGQKTGQANYSSLSSLKPTPTPVSGRASPSAGHVSQHAPAKTSTPSNDSFSNLVAFSSANPNKNLTLQEQQKQREQNKFQQLVSQKQKLQDQWAGSDDAWNNLGSGRSTPALPIRNGTPASTTKEDDDDLFAAFNQPAERSSRPIQKPAPQQSTQLDDDDDPFGLAEFQARKIPSGQSTEPFGADDDDILGDLGRPVQKKPPPRKEPPRRDPSPEPLPVSDHPQDKAVAELVDMGFPADRAKRALEATDNGLNVQAAVGLLLNQAHEEAKQKAKGRSSGQPQEEHFDDQPAKRSRQKQADLDRGRAEVDRRDRSSTPAGDAAKTAQEFGSAFMKTAGAFWKQAQKQVQQAVNDFNSDSESGASTPRWMQEPAAPQQRSKAEPSESRQSKPDVPQQPSNVTDEAMMLEAERPTPPPKMAHRSRPEQMFDTSTDNSRDHSPAVPSRLRESHSPQPAFARQQQQDPLAGMMRPKPQQAPRSSRDMLSKQAAEEQASQAYVSSARRRKPATPTPSALQQEGDLLEGSSSAQSLPSRPTTRSAPPQQQRPSPKPATPIASRPPPPTRTIPSISTIALKASYTARVEGNNHFKRGDYSAAHEAYSTSLRHIPSSHPLQLVLLTNRALTALKTGQPKIAIVDADAAITLVGPSKGDGETVDLLDGGSTPKPMRDYYGKALMRKAEALENMEKWADAAAVWRQCVEDGHGGATAIQSRMRAEKAAAPKPAAPVRKPPPRSATRSAPPVSTKPAAAVTALRAQNQAAERLDDEKFALADVVSDRINSWRNGKEGNLRALLATLDTVLWEGAGWKKISMADLVIVSKVKIHYMKGIGKCHPDKVSNDCTFGRSDSR